MFPDVLPCRFLSWGVSGLGGFIVRFFPYLYSEVSPDWIRTIKNLLSRGWELG